MFSVTATVCGLLPAAAEAMLTRPEYVPAARPVVFTETVSARGVVPLVGVADSQLPPEVVEVVAV
jgi:hypothetical protein